MNELEELSIEAEIANCNMSCALVALEARGQTTDEFQSAQDEFLDAKDDLSNIVEQIADLPNYIGEERIDEDRDDQVEYLCDLIRCANGDYFSAIEGETTDG